MNGKSLRNSINERIGQSIRNAVGSIRERTQRSPSDSVRRSLASVGSTARRVASDTAADNGLMSLPQQAGYRALSGAADAARDARESDISDGFRYTQMSSDGGGDYGTIDSLLGENGSDSEENYYETDSRPYQNVQSMRDEQLNILTDQAIENGLFDYNEYTGTDGMQYYDTAYTTLESNPFAYDPDAEDIADSSNVQIYTLADGSQVMDLSVEADRERYEFMKSLFTNPANATMLGAHLVSDENGTRYEGGYYFPPTEEGLAAFDIAYQNTFGHDAMTLDQLLANRDMDRLSQMMADDDTVYYLAGQLATTQGTGDSSYRPMDNLDITGGGTTLGSLVGSDATDDEAAQMAAAYLANELVDYAEDNESNVMDYMSFGDWSNLMNNAYGVDLTRNVSQDSTHRNESEYDDTDVDFDYLEDVYSSGGSLTGEDGIWLNNALSQTPQYAYVMWGDTDE